MSLENSLLEFDPAWAATAIGCGFCASPDGRQEDDRPLGGVWNERDDYHQSGSGPPPVAEQLELLARFSVQCAREKSLAAILENACLVAADGTVAQWVAFYRHDADQHVLSWQAGVGSAAFRQPRRQAPDQSNPAGFAWVAKRLIVSSVPVIEHRFLTSGAWSAIRKCRAANVPIHSQGGDPFGVIQVGLAHVNAVRPRDLLFLDALATDLADIVRHHATILYAGTQMTARAAPDWPAQTTAVSRSSGEPPGSIMGYERYG